MAINPNILLQGIVPDIAGSVAKGLQVGQEIKNAPIRNRLLQLQEQDVQLKQGLAQAGVISNAVGDLSIEELANPEVYSSRIDALKRAGVPVKPENDPMSDAFTGFDSAAGRLFQTSQLANRAQIQAGVGRRRVQSSKDMGGGVWQMIFNDGSSEVRVPTAEDLEQIKVGRQRELDFLRRKEEERAGGRVGGTIRTEADLAKEQAETEAEIARSKAQAEADVKLKTEPEIQKAIVQSKEQARRDEETAKDLKTLGQVSGSLDRFDVLLDEGIYTGSLGDKLVKGLARGGIVFDQDQLNRTARARQIATNLKFMAKPAGMGAMSDSEWKIIRDAIPDPDSSTVEEIKAGLDEFRIRLEERAGVTRAEVTETDIDNMTEEELDAFLAQ